MTHTASCPECGAPHYEGLDCWGQLGMVLSWEWNDPALAAEHFLTVACWNLQHPSRFTDEALAGLCAAFMDYLDKGTGIREIRRRMGVLADGPARVLRREPDRHPVLRSWPLTIAEVAAGGDSTGAAGRVRAWAAAIRAELRSPRS